MTRSVEHERSTCTEVGLKAKSVGPKLLKKVRRREWSPGKRSSLIVPDISSKVTCVLLSESPF